MYHWTINGTFGQRQALFPHRADDQALHIQETLTFRKVGSLKENYDGRRGSLQTRPYEHQKWISNKHIVDDNIRDTYRNLNCTWTFKSKKNPPEHLQTLNFARRHGRSHSRR